MDWGGKDYPFQPGSNVKALGPGIHVPLERLSGEGRVAFKFKLGLNGMDDFSIVPLGRDTEVRLTSTWPHPSFVGQYLPETRQISATGFDATWHTSWFSTNANERFQQCGEDHCEALNGTVLGVRLIEPVDVYLMSERSVKYGFLFVFLTFGAFFLFEALKRVGIHPVQYGMVGLALALFFLLLISVSEHIAFPLAYSIAASSCVALVGFYVSHVLHHARWGVGFGAMLGALYGLLYVLLQSEDYALLLGSVLLFALLAVAMILTRQVDWYQLSGSSEPPREPVNDSAA
jgi:inner membrane protein